MTKNANSLHQLLKKNAAWAEKCVHDSPNFFRDLSGIQSPQYLWIGCSDARVPANTLLGLKPGEVFVHRNIANQVLLSDLNCMAVLQHAIETLHIKEIIVCGHYGCGGVQGVLGLQAIGAEVAKWLQPLRTLCLQKKAELDVIHDVEKRSEKLAELNVHQQVLNLCQTSFVQKAWQIGRAHV